jgi:hypothetical protein
MAHNDRFAVKGYENKQWLFVAYSGVHVRFSGVFDYVHIIHRPFRLSDYHYYYNTKSRLFTV